MRRLGRRTEAGTGHTDEGKEISSILLRAAAQVEEIVIAARRATAELDREAAAIGRTESLGPRAALLSDVTHTVGVRADALRLEAEELARMLKRSAVQLNGSPLADSESYQGAAS